MLSLVSEERDFGRPQFIFLIGKFCDGPHVELLGNIFEVVQELLDLVDMGMFIGESHIGDF